MISSAELSSCDMGTEEAGGWIDSPWLRDLWAVVAKKNKELSGDIDKRMVDAQHGGNS